MSHTILVVDDDPAVLRLFKRGLVGEGYNVETANGGAEAIRCLDGRPYDVLLTDVSMPEVDGLAVLEHAVRGNRARASIVITGESSIALAVRAMREGAADFLPKPVDPDTLVSAVAKVLGLNGSTPDDSRAWRDTYAAHIVGEDPALLEIFGVVERVSNTECSVLIMGSSGTGKELIARAVHDSSDRAPKPFVAVNCAAIPKELMESEIFGHTKGAFTGATEKREGKFQVADGGTLFLDEIGEMDLSLQGKFLRVLQDKEITAVGESRSRKVDVRVVAATNQDLAARVAEGLFREDLYYRLNVIPVEIPALKNRPADIVPLAEHFVRRASARHKRSFSGLDDDAKKVLLAHSWPGNVRELENLIERVVVLKKEEGVISTADLPASVGAADAARLGPAAVPAGGLDIKATLEEVETRLTSDALRRSGGNKAKAATLLGLKRTTLIERLKRLGIDGA